MHIVVAVVSCCLLLLGFCATPARCYFNFNYNCVLCALHFFFSNLLLYRFSLICTPLQSQQVLYISTVHSLAFVLFLLFGYKFHFCYFVFALSTFSFWWALFSQQLQWTNREWNAVCSMLILAYTIHNHLQALFFSFCCCFEHFRWLNAETQLFYNFRIVNCFTYRIAIVYFRCRFPILISFFFFISISTSKGCGDMWTRERLRASRWW